MSMVSSPSSPLVYLLSAALTMIHFTQHGFSSPAVRRRSARITLCGDQICNVTSLNSTNTTNPNTLSFDNTSMSTNTTAYVESPATHTGLIVASAVGLLVLMVLVSLFLMRKFGPGGNQTETSKASKDQCDDIDKTKSSSMVLPASHTRSKLDMK